MKKIILLLLLSFAIQTKAQYYTFSKITGSSYFSLSGAKILINSNWSYFEKGIKMPFTFKYWGENLLDSIWVNSHGEISKFPDPGGEIMFLREIMNSRGNTISSVNYILEGSAPNRIFKIEYKNVGFKNDMPGLTDYASVQVWLYETSNIIEFHYGPRKVKKSTWGDGGPFVSLRETAATKYLILEGDPNDPIENTTDIFNQQPIDSLPFNGMIYRFAPTTGGIHEPDIKINIINNKIFLPSSVEVRAIQIFNSRGQLVQSAKAIYETNLFGLVPGIYFIVVNTKDGVIKEKKFLE